MLNESFAKTIGEYRPNISVIKSMDILMNVGLFVTLYMISNHFSVT